LHVSRQFLLLHLAEGIAQFAGSLTLRSRQATYGRLHLLFEIPQSIDLALAPVR
jgi:hypothetical protein